MTMPRAQDWIANPKVDAYVGRSTKWPAEMQRLRPILLGRGLTEEIKWGKPCYSSDGRNIVILQEMNDFLSVMFFKGALLSDPHGLLEEQGPNSRSALRMLFTSVAEIDKHAAVVAAYIDEAIEVENRGLEIAAPPALVLVEELQQRLRADPALNAAFQALTPGRQREYNMFCAAAKQASTRLARIDKYVDSILAGKGMRE